MSSALAEKPAFIFDMNGTMINDMAWHNKAWYKIVHDELGSPISFEGVKKEMYGKNEDLLFRVFPGRKFSAEELLEISQRKERYYQADYKPHLQFIDGLGDFLTAAEKLNIKMAIASAAVPGNISFVLDNLGSRKYFDAIVSADDVVNSKPDPETFLKAAEHLKISPAVCIVFEDAPKGIEGAIRAGMKNVVLTTMHAENEFPQDSSTLFFIKDYKDPRLLELLR